MSMKSTHASYGTVARMMHWAIAVAVFAMVGSGLAADAAGPAGAGILRFHVAAGVTVVALTLLRIVWWVAFDRKPQPLPMPRWQGLAARGTHVALYVLVLALGASGIAMMVLSGAGYVLFAGAPGPLPDFAAYPPRAPHGVFAWALIGFVVLHVGAAMYHRFMLKDRLLARMGLGA